MKKNPEIRWRRVDTRSLDLRDWKAAVVGGTGGLGRAISRALVARGARVTVVGRTFRDRDVAGIDFVEADLSLMREAGRVGKTLPAEELDLVVLTTGTFAAPKRQETAEGIERDMAVSYLSRLVLLREMAPRLGQARPDASAKPRVFVMGYPGTGQVGILGDLNAERSYGAMKVHMNTVAGNEMLVIDAARRYPHASFFGLNPGIIRTNIRDNFLGANSLKSRVLESLVGLFTPTPEAYAERLLPLLVSPDLEGHSGALFDRKGNAIQRSEGLSDSHVSAFLAASAELVSKNAGVTV